MCAEPQAPCGPCDEAPCGHDATPHLVGAKRSDATGLVAGCRDHLVLTWTVKDTKTSTSAISAITPSPARRHPVATPERAAAPAPAAPAAPAAVPAAAAPPAVPKAAEAEPLAETLKTMQSHLEIMVRTVQLLDQRLALNEEQVNAMRAELLQARPQPSPPPPSALPAVPDPLLPKHEELPSKVDFLAPTAQEEELRRELASLRELL
ncbi:unnamed protein product [Durusdinium trenchii]|uniref:Uncharacterized protein n=1 Tax=Durusdinium trenchii TaxID=1381693 RepID=A0ABP0SZP3_9DINO